jgi:hypothetical protein
MIVPNLRGQAVTDQLVDVVERYHAAARAFARGEPAQMKSLFSRADDVVLAIPSDRRSSDGTPHPSGWISRRRGCTMATFPRSSR